MSAPTHKQYRILLVEDNADAANIMSLLLEMKGHETRVTWNGQEALRMMEDLYPEVVIVDIQLPLMNGYELACHIRKLDLEEQPLLIAVTGYGTEKDIQDASDAGFDLHFVKPVHIDEILRAIEQYVEDAQ